ncbi:ADP-ribosylglycohydrolase family protein [Kitasatospora sp. NPDC096147]|uniref:ADP-ribosylglycohydrolase family protein n=1 Tax=Kitasatospora sp. NPDC096147 TaxID=3364093 RepID=UPI00381AB4A7
MTISPSDRVRGSLLGGALGDALGWPVEFRRLERIRDDYGPLGVTGLRAADRPGDRAGDITDDTQMTLFTVEGLLAGGTLADLHRSYRHWLLTQHRQGPGPAPASPLLAHAFLYARRAPGNACLSGLEEHPDLVPPVPSGLTGPVNGHSKGCGTVMRSAPFGLLGLGPEQSFERAAQAAQLTHGHPTGQLAAGAFAALIDLVLADRSLPEALAVTVELLERHPNATETVEALDRAVRIAAEGPPSAEAVERVGLGWIAEECLAIAVYCALATDDPRSALLLAVNHSGDSDSTGAVCGNLVGALYGAAALPADWLAVVEGRELVAGSADALLEHAHWV